MGLHSVSDFYAVLPYSFTRVAMASNGDDSSLPAIDTAESSSNSAL